MPLPQKAIDQFKKIYKKLYKKDLSNKEATYRTNNLVDLYKAVYGHTYSPEDKKKK